MPPLRILIVEDQREVSRLLRSALETLQKDMIISECPSGEEALLEAFSGQVDMLVSDYFLPGMNGIELMGKIRKSNSRVKIILITGLADPNVRHMVSEAGADASFLKPVPMADFLDSVERLLGLVAGTLPSEPKKTDPEKEFQQKLPDLMAKLRQDLEAAAVYFLNETGRVLGRAGDMPDIGDEDTLLSLLPSIHSTGLKVAHMLGQGQPTNIHIIRGEKYDLFTTPVSLKYSLLVMGSGLAGDDVRIRNAEIIDTARRQAMDLLGEKEKDMSASDEPKTTPREAILSAKREMEPLFLEGGKKIHPADADEFWNRAAENHKGTTESDRLTYEQAKKLGIAPEKK
jgi:CheY-like chemotaxis protein